MGKKSRRGAKVEPVVATIAYYGPDDRTPAKVVVGIVPTSGKEPTALKRWVGLNVTSDPTIQREIVDFVKSHGATKVAVTDGIIGCPHEEGIDFPIGEDCPFCPFWRGKQ